MLSSSPDEITITSVWRCVKPVFHSANFFARREAKTRIRQRDWLTLVGEKIRREKVGTVPTYFSVRANKFAKWKTGFSEVDGDTGDVKGSVIEK